MNVLFCLIIVIIFSFTRIIFQDLTHWTAPL